MQIQRRRPRQKVSGLEFLWELRGFRLRTLRLNAFDLAPTARATAFNRRARRDRSEVRGEIRAANCRCLYFFL